MPSLPELAVSKGRCYERLLGIENARDAPGHPPFNGGSWIEQSLAIKRQDALDCITRLRALRPRQLLQRVQQLLVQHRCHLWKPASVQRVDRLADGKGC